ncbi:MAG: hypothetical protein ACT4QA_22645 [Panacagrimonas sp.]
MSDSTRPLILKRGATFRFSGVVKDDLGNPLDITAMTLASQVRRDSGALVGSAEFTKLNQTTNRGGYTALFPSTAAWPLVLAIWDVRVIDGADKLITPTRYIQIARAATEDTP